MKLINDFFFIVESLEKDGEYRCKVRLNKEHPLYMVHFPQNPVTPGVCLVQISSEILEEHFGKEFILKGAGSIKFKKIVKREDTPTFIFSNYKEQEGEASVFVSVEDERTQYIKMSLHYQVI